MRLVKEAGLDIHPARYPENLVEYFILMLTDVDDLVFDPFMGSGTTACVAKRLGRHWLGCDVETQFVQAANIRLGTVTHFVKPSKTKPRTLDDLPD
jgi:DNA modification methylase